jgi:hypothetical protein
MPNIFQDNTKSIPKSDAQIVRVNMEELEIGGRKSHLPGGSKATDMSISHVPNAGSKT